MSAFGWVLTASVYFAMTVFVLALCRAGRTEETQ